MTDFNYNKFDEIESELKLGHYDLGWNESSFWREGILKSMRANYAQEKILLRELKDILRAQYELRAQYSMESMKMGTFCAKYSHHFSNFMRVFLFFLTLISLLYSVNNPKKENLHIITSKEYYKILNCLLYSFLGFQFFHNIVYYLYYPLTMRIYTMEYNKLIRTLFISWLISIDLFGISFFYMFVRFIEFNTRDIREIFVMSIGIFYFLLTVFLSKFTLYYCNFFFVLTPLSFFLHQCISNLFPVFLLSLFYPNESVKKSLVLSNIISFSFYIQIQINFIEIRTIGNNKDEKFHNNSNRFHAENKEAEVQGDTQTSISMMKEFGNRFKNNTNSLGSFRYKKKNILLDEDYIVEEKAEDTQSSMSSGWSGSEYV